MMLACEIKSACEVMGKPLKSQGRGGKTGSSCEGMAACQGMAACEAVQQQIQSQRRGGRTGLSCEVV